jgi:hypothetical protein
MNEQQEIVFWETIDIFDKEGLLSYIMIIGSWAEYIYSFYFVSNFEPNLRTRDLDFLYRNVRKPSRKVNIATKLLQKGFVYNEDPLTGVGKFHKGNVLEIEFLTRALGKGEDATTIPSIGIIAESLRGVNMLADYPLELDCRDYIVSVPEPAAYVLQKLYISEKRKPEKRDKDIRAVRELLKHIKSSEKDNKKLNIIYNGLHKNHQKMR